MIGPALSLSRRWLPIADGPGRRAEVDAAASACEPPSAVVSSEIEALVYELLDAHADTADLAAELDWKGDQRWSMHIDYLRALQRTGRQALANFGMEHVA
jgi:hypothetical protein